MLKSKGLMVIIAIIFVLSLIAFLVVNLKSENNLNSDVWVYETHIQLLNYTLEELMQNSEYIIIGKCVGQDKCKYSQTAHPISGIAYETISTDFNIELNTILKGNIDNNIIVIRSDIGQLGNQQYVCREQVSFSEGEQVLLFLNKDTLNSDDCYRASYFICSKYVCISENEYYNEYFGNTIILNEMKSLLEKI